MLQLFQRAPKSRGSADDDQAHLRENRWQNQAFEGNCFNHLSRLLRSRRPPDFLALSYTEIRLAFLAIPLF